MREIKFREWETERKTMIVGKREDCDDSIGFRFAHEEGGERILMQYTGLNDKNGKDIYEGDIVKVSNHPFDNKGTFNNNYIVSWQDEDLTYVAGNLLLSRLKPYVEVIGNIYDNPELLEVAK
ncbi:YopX family protein [Carnobacterium maltaromaticum]|uniref:YopX family protein n=1 Tax=Carnobacterium maltaromaticum TaxID=2751 RepID=UPI0039AFAD30